MRAKAWSLTWTNDTNKVFHDTIISLNILIFALAALFSLSLPSTYQSFPHIVLPLLIFEFLYKYSYIEQLITKNNNKWLETTTIYLYSVYWDVSSCFVNFQILLSMAFEKPPNYRRINMHNNLYLCILYLLCSSNEIWMTPKYTINWIQSDIGKSREFFNQLIFFCDCFN